MRNDLQRVKLYRRFSAKLKRKSQRGLKSIRSKNMFDVSNLDFPNIMNLSFGTSKNFNKYKPRIKLKTFYAVFWNRQKC